MNTKVNKLKKMYNMRLNNAEKAVERLEEHLPKKYTSLVIDRVKKSHGNVINDQLVRNVKCLRTKNPDVFKVILEIAKESEKKLRDLEKVCE